MRNKAATKKDLFVQTQKKLTLTYTGLIILLLVLFSAIVFGLMLGVVYKEQRANLQAAMYATENGNLVIPDLTDSSGSGLFFYYVLDENGAFVAGSEAIPMTRTMNLREMSEWQPQREAYRLSWIRQPHHHEREVHGPKREDILLFVGARPFTTKDGKIETIYAAQDLTFYFEVLQILFWVFLTIIVLFLIVAVWFSYKMSKKAMIPIQKAYQQQQQFLADASHELRTPLSVMNTSFEVIELEHGEDLSPYSKEVLSDMKEEVGRMSRMVQHLLLLARSDSGTAEIELAAFDLAPKVRQWVQSFEALASKKQISVRAELPDTLTVTGDAERIKQVVYILLDNAIKYTPEDGTIAVALDREAKQWSLSVRDTGIGIPADDVPRIFDRFYRVEKHRSRAEGSAGLGLSIAKWIVKAHRGSLEVVSVVGEGSTFIVRIPYA
ncbi:sensor histidine kinase [Paenibacillus aestuarii]|uniref:histidine kinase n=1 Tax=Paenibacillus aestuarii TaxID=516965 RepID=A0ABW0K7T7_9BACL|nr:ATP-binding protein [Paenibacillus aestuarii]